MAWGFRLSGNKHHQDDFQVDGIRKIVQPIEKSRAESLKRYFWSRGVPQKSDPAQNSLLCTLWTSSFNSSRFTWDNFFACSDFNFIVWSSQYDFFRSVGHFFWCHQPKNHPGGVYFCSTWPPSHRPAPAKKVRFFFHRAVFLLICPRGIRISSE